MNGKSTLLAAGRAGLLGLSIFCVHNALLADGAAAALVPIPPPPGLTGTAAVIPPPPGSPPPQALAGAVAPPMPLPAGASALSPSASTALPVVIPPPPPVPGAAVSAPHALSFPPPWASGLSGSAAVLQIPAQGLSAPMYLTAVAGNGSVALSWYPSVGSSATVSGYLIYRGKDPAHISPAAINLTPVTEAVYLDNDADSAQGPVDRQTYYYRVRSFAADGRLSPYSAVTSARPSGPLLPPGGFTADALDNEVVLTWRTPLSTGDADLAHLILLRGEGQNPPAPYKVLAPDALGFTDKGLPDGAAFTYAVLSEDMRGKQSGPSAIAKAVPYKRLEAPEGLSGIGLGEDIVRLKWNAPPDTGTFRLKGYNIYRATVGTDIDYSQPPLNKSLVFDTRFEDDGDDSVWAPVLGTQYSYTVVAVDSQGLDSDPSAADYAGPVASITKLESGTINVMSGNTLQIEGRKTISMSNTWILWRQNAGNTYGASSPSSFDLQQQLQVQLSGQVGRKIKVDVDYDDQAAANQQQKISVVYNGDSEEVFKEFAFGDIQMDLSSSRSEFVNYNKSLFGAKLKLDSPDERLRITAIGAQTQGFTETKSFVGGYEEVMNGTTPGHNYTDTSFVAYKYYFLSREEDLVEGANSVIPGSVVVYVDEPGVSNLNPNRVTVTNPTTKTTFNFVPLNANVDYLVDNKSGLITFNAPIQPNYNIFVAFKTAQAMTGQGACNCSSVGYDSNGQVNIKDGNAGSEMASNNISGVSDASHCLIQNGALNGATSYDGHMCAEFYSLGDRQIMDPKLDPNFKFIIYGPNQSIVYQMDPRSDYTNVVNFDTTLGNMRFRVPYPFAQGNGAGQMQGESPFGDVTVPYNGSNLDCYNLVQRTSNYTIHVEYQHKLSNYELRPNIIHGSDTIVVNGRHVVRDVDYFLDYDTGILVFNNPDLVTDSSTVQCTYEYLPFGDQFTSTVWGVRTEYDLTDDLSLGSTYLSDSANAPQETPSITGGVYSLQILDGDIQAQVPQDAVDSVTKVISPRSGFLAVKASAEAAESWFSPNTYSRNNENGVAMVDDFESVNSVVATSTLRQNWFPSSIPAPAGSAITASPLATNRVFTHLYTVQNPAHNAAVLTEAGEDPSINMLRLDWANFTSSSDWDAYVYSFGPTPNQAASQASLLQVWLQTTNTVTVHIDVGQINEDAADTGVLETESTTGILASGQDIGIVNPGTVGSPYPCPQLVPGRFPDPGYWGWNNGILDTEDFEQTGVLDTANNYYSFSVVVNPSAQQSGVNNNFQELNLDLTQLASQPGVTYGIHSDGVQMSTAPGSSTYYTNISRVRVWIDGASSSQGSLLVESVQFVGNKWQVRADPNLVNAATGVSNTADSAVFQVQAVNESSALSLTANVAYVPDLDFYTVDSTHSSTVEQALELQYAMADNSAQGMDPATGKPYFQARRVLSTGTPVDFGQYTNMRVDVFKPGYLINGKVVTSMPGETLLIRLAADDQDYFEYSVPLDNIGPGGWSNQVLALDGSDGNRIQVGTPYLRQINYAAFSVRVTGKSLNYAIGTPQNQEALWINNLRVTDPVTRQGGAQRFALNYNLMGGKVVVNQTYHNVDSDFIQIDQQNNLPQQHAVNNDVNAKINVVDAVPATVDYCSDQVFTDGQNQGDPYYSQNFTDPNQSDNKTSVDVAFNGLPGLSLDANGYSQHVRQLYLSAYVLSQQTLTGNPGLNPDNTQNNIHEALLASYTMPAKVPLLDGDVVRAETDFTTAKEKFDQALTQTGSTLFEDTATDTRTLKASYAGTYAWGKWATVSPSYAFLETEAEGDVVAPGVVPGQGTAYYSLNEYGQSDGWVPQQRTLNPVLSVQLANLGPVENTKMSYNFTQTMDYVANQMTTPGGLSFSSTFDASALGLAYAVVPPVDLSQTWQVTSVLNDNFTVRGPIETAEIDDWINNNATFRRQFGPLNPASSPGLAAVPNIDLETRAPFLQSVWWPRFGGGPGFFGEQSGPLDIENLASTASRQSTTNLDTHFNLTILPGWTGAFTPRVSITDSRTMSAPEEITENEQWSYGSGIAFTNPRIPFYDTLKPDNLTFDGSYTIAENYVDTVEIPPYLSGQANAYTVRTTLPMKPNDKTTLTLSLAASQNETQSYSLGDPLPTSDSSTFSLSPGVRLVYLWSMSRPWRLPNFWPFYGREMRLTQALRFDNNLTAVLTSSNQNATEATLENTASNLYTLNNTVSYNVLDNVKANFSIEQDYMVDPYASEAINEPGGYYSLKVSLGAEATF